MQRSLQVCGDEVRSLSRWRSIMRIALMIVLLLLLLAVTAMATGRIPGPGAGLTFHIEKVADIPAAFITNITIVTVLVATAGILCGQIIRCNDGIASTSRAMAALELLPNAVASVTDSAVDAHARRSRLEILMGFQKMLTDKDRWQAIVELGKSLKRQRQLPTIGSLWHLFANTKGADATASSPDDQRLTGS